MYLPEGVTAPSDSALQDFFAAASAAHPHLDLTANWEVRCIGLDDDMTRQIFDLIRCGDKTGTFSLPWLIERTDRRQPEPGLGLVFIDRHGRPTLLGRLLEVRAAVFGQVTAADTAIDGSPVRDPAVWIPLHTDYWNRQLAPFGLSVADDMPFWIEPFELLYDADA